MTERTEVAPLSILHLIEAAQSNGPFFDVDETSSGLAHVINHKIPTGTRLIRVEQHPEGVDRWIDTLPITFRTAKYTPKGLNLSYTTRSPNGNKDEIDFLPFDANSKYGFLTVPENRKIVIGFCTEQGLNGVEGTFYRAYLFDA